MAEAIHMMIRVLDPEKSIDFYEKAFGLTVADRFDFDDFTLVYLRNPETDFEVELTVNKDRTEPLITAMPMAMSRSRLRIWTASARGWKNWAWRQTRSRSSIATVR